MSTGPIERHRSPPMVAESSGITGCADALEVAARDAAVNAEMVRMMNLRMCRLAVMIYRVMPASFRKQPRQSRASSWTGGFYAQ
jgi:hypothetical protein